MRQQTKEGEGKRVQRIERQREERATFCVLCDTFNSTCVKHERDMHNVFYEYGLAF